MIYNPAHWFWRVGDDDETVYSAAAAAFVPVTDPAYAAFLAAGGVASAAPTAVDLVAVLVRAGVAPGAALGGRWPVMTYTIVRRLETAGKQAEALAALDADPLAKILFQTAQWIWSDDATSIALISGIGADPSQILAFDPNWRP